MDWPLLADLPPDDVRELLSIARRRTFDKGEVVFHRDDPAESLHLIVRGRFAARVASQVGDSVLLDVLGPGQAFGELALLLPGERRSATVSALEAGETRSVFRDDFARLQRSHPGVKDVLLRLLAEQVRRTSDRIVEAHHVDADTRVRRRLCELAETYGSGDDEPVVPLTQEDLAAIAGTSRATVNRVLREEEKRGSRRARARTCDAARHRGARRPLSLAELAREVVEERAEQTVEALRRRDAEPLAGGVRADDLGAERDHLDTGELASDHGALEAAVNHFERRRYAEQTLEGRSRALEQRRSRGRAATADTT